MDKESPYWQHRSTTACSPRFDHASLLTACSDRYFEDFYVSKPGENYALMFRTAGVRHCEPNFHIINKESSRYAMHFILAGEGWCDGTVVHSGDVVFFDRKKLHNFSSSCHDPCVYAWITFKGGASADLLREIGLSNHNQIYHIQDLTQICSVFYEMLYTDHPGTNLNLFMESCLLRIFSLAVNPRPLPDRTQYNALKQQHLDASFRYIAANFRRPDFQIAEVADAIGMNPTYFRKLFRDQTGFSIRDYVLRQRMLTAVTLLKDSNYNIGEIANFCGYTSYRQFSEQFKKSTGMAPSKYKGTALK